MKNNKFRSSFTLKKLTPFFVAGTMLGGSNAWAGCDYTVTNQWGSGFTGNVRITNSGNTPTNGWAVNWQYAGDNRISNSWGAQLSGSNPYSATAESWNAVIQPSQSIEIGFQGTGD